MNRVCSAGLAGLACAWAVLTTSVFAGEAKRSGVDVILWFDTEDYLLPADDDATKRLCELLTERGVRATFKLVGEKARVLEKRGRQDVIAALQKHDIGYHANFHSVHPTPSEYLADCGLLDGIAEFVRREGGGAADVRRILGVSTLSCYGQPGSSWGAQTIAALREIGVAPHGVPCYVDEGDHVGLDERPFWFANALVVYHMGRNYTRMELHDPAAVKPALAKFDSIQERLRTQPDRGLISIFYHPCEWVHREFWDGVNFRRGANPPREDWKAPPQRTAAETESAFQRFAEYVDHIRATPGVRFVTASDLPILYPDTLRSRGIAQEELDQMARTLVLGSPSGIDFQMVGGKACSVADQFEILALALSAYIARQVPTFPLLAQGLLGPDSPPPVASRAQMVPWPAFRDATLDAVHFLRTQKRIPSRVFIGPDPVPPSDFLVGLARSYQAFRQTGRAPATDGVELGKNIQVTPSLRVAQDSPNLFGGWIIHREGFRAPRILEVARLQAWTLKPAVRRTD